ncbi:hypothetical protein SM11_chr0245 [Sinorhizobium meliloti SM11]|uniref:GIY-YIG domain-containing protein n=1 Tax=Sinorhizobium meliloti (strain SM11) TaxID=707241 RepID=F7X7T8_SINMM|nr:hypothetical protein [Sinorhizobium meliloti]AEH77528.1 hypothetical protein SM11_chr0245 [Sinorhizobium meliloti SM11]MDE4559587.1 hypothetical protein [Sinorhizobium meliloti SM11]
MSLSFLGSWIQQSAPPQSQHFWWQGASGYWWITTIYPLSAIPDFASTVYVMVRRNDDGSRTPLYIGQTNNTARRMSEHLNDKLFLAQLLGANEIHLHLLAETERDRLNVETDLRNGHLTPLNKQGGLPSIASLYP